MGVGARPVAAVVFDLDGVLIDSEPVWEEIRHGLVDERGGRWPADAQARLMGMSTAEWSRYLSDELRVGMPPDQAAAVVIDRVADRYAVELPLMPGADAALRRLAARWPLGLASSSPRRLIDSVLETAGWDALFLATVSTEEVAKGKPAPDVYQAVAGQLGQPAAACAAVEDSSNGLRSAAAAGMLVIAIPHPRYPPQPDAIGPAARVLTSLAELTPAAIEQAAR
jgi:HAD superfamily hydrolase (TIGR01509 family)